MIFNANRRGEQMKRKDYRKLQDIAILFYGLFLGTMLGLGIILLTRGIR